jgi:hypothetical protein
VSKPLTQGLGSDVGACTGQDGTLDSFHIGDTQFGASPVNYFNGLLDDVRVYNRSLSATEIQQLYKLGSVTVK